MTPKTITSATNPLIKNIARLHNAPERKKTNLCIIEGQRALSTALEKLTLDIVFCTEKMLPIAQELADEDQIILISAAIMKKISTATAPSGLLGVVHIPKPPSEKLLSPGLVLAQIYDPGNMGTLLRTAVACKLSSVVIVGGCDPWSPKVVQATAGTSAHLNIFNWTWEKLLSAKEDLTLYGLVVHDGKSPQEIDPKKALLVIGSEAQGIPQEWIAQCATLITLPMPGEAESLNAAVAGSIAAYLTFVRG